jgi:hypothetical protein
MINSRLQKVINKYIDRTTQEGDEDYFYTLNELYDEVFLRDIEYEYLVEGVFNYIIHEKNEDPFDHFDEGFLDQNFYPSVVSTILTDTGWYDKYYTINRFIIPDKNNNENKRSVYNDITVEGDNIYLIVGGWSDLDELFNGGDQNLAKRVLGEDFAELYGWFDVDFDVDVWDNLDEKSIEHIKNYIRENNFIGMELDYEPDGYDTNILTEEMLEDNAILGVLIDEEDIFSDLNGELEGFYRWAYESAAEDELFSELKGEIVSLLQSDGEWDYNKNNHVLKFNVSKIFMDINTQFLNCTGNFADSEYSNFLDVLSKYLECEDKELSVRNMDYYYPDSSKVEEHLNYNVVNNL